MNWQLGNRLSQFLHNCTLPTRMEMQIKFVDEDNRLGRLVMGHSSFGFACDRRRGQIEN